MDAPYLEQWLSLQLASLGRAVRVARVRLNMSREDLADASGVGVRQVGKIERGERGQLDQLWRIAAALGMSLSDLARDGERVVRQMELTGVVADHDDGRRWAWDWARGRSDGPWAVLTNYRFENGVTADIVIRNRAHETVALLEVKREPRDPAFAAFQFRRQIEAYRDAFPLEDIHLVFAENERGVARAVAEELASISSVDELLERQPIQSGPRHVLEDLDDPGLSEIARAQIRARAHHGNPASPDELAAWPAAVRNEDREKPRMGDD